MAYTATTWAKGDKITSAKLNNLESGVADAAPADSVAHVTGYNNAGAHNSIFRGKYLGTSVTSTQAANISAGTFTDLYVGDYWTINDVNYRIAGFDYWYQCGNTALTTHNAVVVPDKALYKAPMNATNTTDGAYVGSAMYTCEEITVSSTAYTGLANAISTIEAAFGDYLLAHDAYFANAVTSGRPSAGAWYSDREVDLMTEQMLCGSAVMQQMSYGGTVITNQRIEKSQLPLFALSPQFINIRGDYWLRDVASTTMFPVIYATGSAAYATASNVYGVRPYFLIS